MRLRRAKLRRGSEIRWKKIVRSARLACGASLLSITLFALPVAGVANDDYAARMGTVYTTGLADTSPHIKQIALPKFPGADAVWGSSGRDHRGHIWIGVSADGGDLSAHLIEFVPETGDIIDRGDVVSELKKAGIYRDGESQVKIHTKIIEAADGYLYFASTDEEGEAADGSSPPTWGSHLWRLHLDTNIWEHIQAVPHGLTALAGNGRWIYALGLWDHVLYQYDTESGAFHHVVVGSVDGHMSRNLVADHRGHVYVPRLSRKIGLFVKLVEFDTTLKEVGQTSLNEYTNGRRKISRVHGIIGFAYLADGSIVFTTHIGYLYRIVPAAEGQATVTPIGYFHPDGAAYASSLFSLDGDRYLAGVTRARRTIEWVVYDLEKQRSIARSLNFDDPQTLLYGSITRDDAGRMYIVGRSGPGAPLLLQVDALR